MHRVRPLPVAVPCWATDKPLSPKLMIMDLRDHMFASAPYILATSGAGKRDAIGERNEEVRRSARR